MKVNETATAAVIVTNNGADVAPMVILDLPIPAGFGIISEDFDHLTSLGKIAKYQITPRSVIVYLRQLPPNEPFKLTYRLWATMPVKITAPPAKSYEYYNPEHQASSLPVPLSVGCRRLMVEKR